MDKIFWLVVEPLPLWKMMEWKSVGSMKFPTEWKVIKFMFQTTKQLWHCFNHTNHYCNNHQLAMKTTINNHI